jgi:hypothetical protein
MCRDGNSPPLGDRLSEHRHILRKPQYARTRLWQHGFERSGTRSADALGRGGATRLRRRPASKVILERSEQ